MLPSEIYLYGMPLNLSSWNGKYKLIGNTYHLVNDETSTNPIYGMTTNPIIKNPIINNPTTASHPTINTQYIVTYFISSINI